MDMNLTEIIFLLDRSGSMGGFEKDTIGGFNDFVETQSRMKGQTLVTTVLFDDKYEILWSGVDAKDAKLSKKHYFVRGTTALLDAVGKTILDMGCRLSNTPDDRRPGKVIVVITTDGQENASREFTYEKVRNLIRHQQEKYNWEFIFLGANIDAEEEAENIGINSANAYEYEASKKGIGVMYATACRAVSEMRQDKK